MNKPTIIMSERVDGTMQFVGGETALANRKRFFEKNGIAESGVVAGQLINGTEVKWVTKQNGGEKMIATDGLITTDPNLWLSITVADCLPIVVYGEGVVALLHGGWRGLAGGIASKAVALIRERLGNEVELAAWIGPGIEGHHYPVAQEVAQRFEHTNGAVQQKSGEWELDLKTVAVAELKSCGIEQIEVSPVCTYCQADKYFSARHDKVIPTEAMIVMVKI